jgi:RNA polymerase sigma factor (sigma-70 family)
MAIDVRANLYELELVKGCLKGDRMAQFQLYQQYAKAMYNVSYRMMNNREEAEDLLQESFMYAFDNLANYRYESSVGIWLKQIVINKCINALKKKSVKLVFDEEIEPSDEYEVYNPEKEKKINYEVNKVMEAMNKLPDGYRIIFSLYLVEGYDHIEIAKILGISENTSKTQYLRAKKKLINILTDINNEG